MKKFIIGALVLLIGVPGFAFNFSNFLFFLAGMIPALMILGGAIAVYLGIEELKQSDDSAANVEPEIELGAARLEKSAEKSKKESEPVTTEPVPVPIEQSEEAVSDNQDEQPEPEAQQQDFEPLRRNPSNRLNPQPLKLKTRQLKAFSLREILKPWFSTQWSVILPAAKTAAWILPQKKRLKPRDTNPVKFACLTRKRLF